MRILSLYLDVNESDQFFQQDQEVLVAHRKVCKCHQNNIIHPTSLTPFPCKTVHV